MANERYFRQNKAYKRRKTGLKVSVSLRVSGSFITSFKEFHYENPYLLICYSVFKLLFCLTMKAMSKQEGKFLEYSGKLFRVQSRKYSSAVRNFAKKKEMN